MIPRARRHASSRLVVDYPNIMILGYLNSNDAADPRWSRRPRAPRPWLQAVTGYETTQKGYECSAEPGQRATAYGSMEFADMAKVYDVDRKMVERTADC